ncbi:DUF3110 domain-containing protein [bacterium]|nr:DUF3110 domain-containing protein [bacterium]
MFILTIDGKEDEGAYSVIDDNGETILYIFEEEDDAVRYAMMLEEEGYPEISVIEVDDNLIFQSCEISGYRYAVITKNDIVIPPQNNGNFS